MRDWSNWPEAYYSTTDRDERLELLTERLESAEADNKDRIRKDFWDLRYKKRDKMPEGVDYFIRAWMDLYFISKKPESKWLHKQHMENAQDALNNMGFKLAAELGGEAEEVLYEELCHGVEFYIGLCKTDSKYNSQLLGILKVKPDHLVEKIANELWRVSVLIPQSIGHEKEFKLLEKACRETFWKEFPKYIKDNNIKLKQAE